MLSVSAKQVWNHLRFRRKRMFEGNSLLTECSYETFLFESEIISKSYKTSLISQSVGNVRCCARYIGILFKKWTETKELDVLICVFVTKKVKKLCKYWRQKCNQPLFWSLHELAISVLVGWVCTFSYLLHFNKGKYRSNV